MNVSAFKNNYEEAIAQMEARNKRMRSIEISRISNPYVLYEPHHI